MSLGRIFNVVGAIIDRYLGFSLSSQFNILIPMDLGMFIESHEQYAYTLCYLNALQIFRQPLILFEFSCYIHNELFWYATTTINIDWLFYTCNLYLGLILKVNRPACPYTSMNAVQSAYKLLCYAKISCMTDFHGTFTRLNEASNLIKVHNFQLENS